MTKSTYISLLVASVALSCGNDSSPEVSSPASRQYLVSAVTYNTIPLQTLQSFAQMANQDQFVDLVKYAVKSYKIVYNTTYNGNPIKASGVLYVPQGISEPAPLISLQHGTTFTKGDAPSVSGQYTGMEYFASAGYIAVMPDFIGYGESKNIFHPYYDKKHAALTVIDMIKASKEFLSTEKIPINEQLFLAGYSEGGYVTLAAAKELETNPAHELSVTAVAAGAGGYDLPEMLNSITGSDYYTYPSYLAFVLMSYNNTYGWNKPLTYFFQDKYATALSMYMNGEYGGSYINNKLTTKVSALLNPDFYKRLQAADQETELKQALKENSVSGWQTSLPIRLYHGTRDEVIPYQNSEVTLQNFKNNGAAQVTLIEISGGTHGSSFVPMIQDFVPWFESLR